MAEFHDFKLPSGVTWCGQTHFNPDFGLDTPKPVKGLERNFVESKSNEWLDRYGYDHIDEEDYKIVPEYIASEVGDDEQLASNSKAFIAIQLVFTELLGTKISLTDTSINPRFGNFSEDMIVLPDTYDQTYLNARNTASTDSMSYMDVPKLRLATDIRPMRMDNSSTNDGKASMVGSRMRWIPMNSPLRGTFEVFNLFQDVNLGLLRDKRFSYLPQSLGGYGKEVPFRNPENFNRFAHSYKNGTHILLIKNIVNRTIDYLDDLGRGMDPPKDPLLSHIVRFQSSFHDWIKAKSVYAPVCWFDAPVSVSKYRIGKFGESSVMDDVMGRLLSEGLILSEQQLQIAQEHNELCKSLVGATNVKDAQEIRESARTSFRNLSIFSQESYGYIKEITLNQDQRNVGDLRAIDIQLFFDSVYAHRYNLRHILGEEFVYWPEAMDEIYRNGPMKVQFGMAPINKIGSIGFAAQSSEYKSDYECTETIGALAKLESWLRDPQGPPPRYIINDDNAIIDECGKHQYNIIVTDDIKLCKEAAKKTRNVVFRVPVKWYYKVTYFGTQHWNEYIQTVSKEQFIEHLDSGSIQSFEEKYFHDGVMLNTPRKSPFNIMKKLGNKDVTVYEEFEDYSDGPTEAVESLWFDTTGIMGVNPKRRPYRVKGSSRQSWR